MLSLSELAICVLHSPLVVLCLPRTPCSHAPHCHIIIIYLRPFFLPAMPARLPASDQAARPSSVRYPASHLNQSPPPSPFTYRASNCTILRRPSASCRAAHQPRIVLQTHLFVRSLYSTRYPHSLHLIASPRLTGTFAPQSPQM